MLSHYTRLIVLGHRWPFQPTGNIEEDLKVLSVRARGVMGGLLVFVLINMALGLMLAFLTPYLPEDAKTAETLPPAMGFAFMLLLVFSFWGFRLTWLYIPYALNIDAKRYLKALGGISASLPMLATWILCFIPFIVCVQLVGSFLAPLVDAAGNKAAGGFAMVILTIIFDTLKNILATAAITYGLMEIFEKEKS
jgi:MFS family permease